MLASELKMVSKVPPPVLSGLKAHNVNGGDVLKLPKGTTHEKLE